MSARRTSLLTSLAAFAALVLAAPSGARAAGAGLVRVPQDAATLAVAIGKVANGGVVELAAGTYPSPPNGFAIRNLGKGFTVRAAPGAAVTLDGGGSGTILRFVNTNRTRGKRVTFERLTFRGGFNDSANEGGAVTISKADALFRQTSFLDNRTAGASGGGAVQVNEGSEATFVDCSFRGNSTRLRGGALEARSSTVTLQRGEMVGNRTNLPGHDPHSFGGAIMVLDGILRTTGTRFEANEAGWVGGAIYAIGSWEKGADLLISDSTFVTNQALPDPCCAIADPTGGGAVHVEDATNLRIHRSAFVRNRADIGAAVDGFRAPLEVHGSVFQANGLPAGHRGGAGGAIAVMSTDSADASTAGGAINRPAGRLVMTRSLLQGMGGADGAPSRGGCILAAGDGPRVYGGGSVPPAGTLAENRATIEIRGSVLADCDAGLGNDGGAGYGGGIFGDIAELLMEDSMVIDSDARGGGSGGGAIALRQQSHARLVRTSFARNSAALSGGTLWSAESVVEQVGTQFLGNSSGPRAGRLVAVPAASSVGAAPSSPLASALGYAWTGSTAKVNGLALAQRAGLLEVGPGDFTLTVDNSAAAAAKAPGTCTAGPFLCLNGNRFRAELSFVVDGVRRTAQAVSLTGDTGAFWFFDPANVELILKELDGRGVNGHFWTFFGALTNLEHTLTITDTVTGSVRVYQNPAGKFASAGDTSAFAAAASAPASTMVSAASAAAADEWLEGGGEAAVAELPAVAPAATCTATDTALCLSGSRIRVEVTWRDFAGHTGVGHAVALSGDTGYFWFTSASNVEVVTKALDARGVNGQYWFFYGALSNVEYTITITDVATGRRKSYTNPMNKFGSLGDTAALPAS